MVDASVVIYQCVCTTVDNDQLVRDLTHNPATKKAAIFRLVIPNVFIAIGRVVQVAITRIV